MPRVPFVHGLLCLLLACRDDGVAERSKSDPGDSGAADSGSETPPPLDEAISVEAMWPHLEALDEISLANESTRAMGTAGYEASVDYATEVLEDAGYTVEIYEFQLPAFREHATPVLALTRPEARTFVAGQDHLTLTGSGAGDVTAGLASVDLMIPPGAENSSTSGCEADDFAEFPSGAIALVQRGTCPFATKVENAANAGAQALLIMNEGQEGRQDAFSGNLGGQTLARIPVLGLSYDTGATLQTLLGGEDEVEVHVVVDTSMELAATWNVLAELDSGDDSRVVLIGAHLDSVPAGPGINDNGSGTALVLAAAEAAQGRSFHNRLRFALWGAEELGLLGSMHYALNLEDDDADAILAYLNFDMVGSPNGAMFVYDGDGSDGQSEAGPEGSAAIEALLAGGVEAAGGEVFGTPFAGNSDYAPFLAIDVPAGGLFTGAGGIKSEDEALAAGGEAGAPHDACYHQLCDDIDNIDAELLAISGAATGHALEALLAHEGELDLLARSRPLARTPETVADTHACGGVFR